MDVVDARGTEDSGYMAALLTYLQDLFSDIYAGTAWTMRLPGAAALSRTLCTALRARGTDAIKPSAAGAAEGGTPARLSFDEMLHGNPLKLQRLPVPPLADTLQRWLATVKPHTEGKPGEWERVQRLAKEFEAGDGAELHRKLVERDAHDAAFPGGVFAKHTYVDYHWEDLYLIGRYACAINCNPFMSLQPAPEGHVPVVSDPQIATAAAFVSSQLKYLDHIVSGKFQPDAGVCPHQHALQVGTARIPKKGVDTLVQHPYGRHIVVIARNRAYEVEVLTSPDKDGQRSHLSLAALAEALEGVAAAARTAGPPPAYVGYLTATDRDDWAEARAALEASGGDNLASLKALDTALCVVALEDGPDAKLLSTAASRAFLMGQDGRNRWFDRHQLCVLPGGAAAVNFEHSYSDGMAWCRNLGQVWHDMYGVPSRTVKPLPSVPTHDTHAPPRELKWDLAPHLVQAIHKAQAGLVNDSKGLGMEFLNFAAFGRADIKRWGVSPDCVVQMSFQRAFYSLHGRLPAVYESATTHFFYRGRTETIRTASSASLAFIQSLQPGSGATKDEQRALLAAASLRHRDTARNSNAAMGVERHLYVMKLVAKELAKATGEAPKGSTFFADPMFELTSTWVCSTSNVAHPFLATFGFGPVTPGGYGLGYMTQENYLPICVSNYHEAGTDAKAMVQCIEATLLQIRDICCQAPTS